MFPTIDDRISSYSLLLLNQVTEETLARLKAQNEDLTRQLEEKERSDSSEGNQLGRHKVNGRCFPRVSVRFIASISRHCVETSYLFEDCKPETRLPNVF